jgi:uncharacterized protein YbjT (DUF2867 family)
MSTAVIGATGRVGSQTVRGVLERGLSTALVLPELTEAATRTDSGNCLGSAGSGYQH